jgi:tRNA A-37 threonylcarbamoyl transferase component Bud32
MVVMEYIRGKTAHEVLTASSTPRRTRSPRLPAAVLHDVKNAIDILHGVSLVFGDLRHPNVIIVDGRAKLIDFDWCGKDGEAT